MSLSPAAAGLATLPRFCGGGDLIGVGLHDAMGDFIRG